MNILKSLAVKDVLEATRAIPVIDFSPAFRATPADPEGLEAVAARGEARQRDRRLLLSRRARGAGRGGGAGLRGLARVPRAAPRGEDAPAAQREQHRLPSGEPVDPEGVDGSQGHPPELQRELLHQPRPGRRSPRRAGGHAAARAQPVAGRARRDARGDGRLLHHAAGGGGAHAAGAGARARDAGRPLRPVLRGRGAHQSALPALPAPGRRGRRAVRAGARTPTTRSSRSWPGWTCRGSRCGCRRGSGWRRR